MSLPPIRYVGLQEQREGQNPSRKYKQSGDGFIDKYGKIITEALKWNYRELYSSEIVLDIDYDNVNKRDVRFIVTILATVFKQENINYMLYDTGGKGYHFHLFFSDLVKYSSRERSIAREYFFLIYGHGIAVDYAKKDENTVIGKEYTRHRKGTEKRLIENHNDGINSSLPMTIKGRMMLRSMQKQVIWPKQEKQRPTDFVRTTKNGETYEKPCISEILRNSARFNINRHMTAVILTRDLKARNLTKDKVCERVQGYMNSVGYKQKTAEYLYDHNPSGVSCYMVRDLLMGTGATQKCKNCAFNNDYKGETNETNKNN